MTDAKSKPKRSVLILCGGAGSGKTKTLNAMTDGKESVWVCSSIEQAMGLDYIWGGRKLIVIDGVTINQLNTPGFGFLLAKWSGDIAVAVNEDSRVVSAYMEAGYVRQHITEIRQLGPHKL